MNVFKGAAKTLLPAPLVRRAQRRRSERLRQRAVRSIDLSRIQLIEQASLAQLRDPSFLEKWLLPGLGLNDEFDA
jgi:hypothetical protein